MSVAVVGGVPVGICKVQFDPVCGNTANGTPHLSCNIVNVDQNTRVEDVPAINIDGGTPGQKCFYLEQPNIELTPEVVFTSCTGVDPILDALTGRLSYIETTVKGVAGYAQQKIKGDNNCLCACSEGGSTCINRVAVTVWRRFYCFGDEGTLHPSGAFWIDHYPALEFQRTAQTRSSTSSADAGTTYLAYAYTNPGYSGPNNLLPVELAGTGYNACYYGFPSNHCPPGACSCGNCDGTDAPEPFGATAGAIQAPSVAPAGNTPQAPTPELVGA